MPSRQAVAPPDHLQVVPLRVHFQEDAGAVEGPHQIGEEGVERHQLDLVDPRDPVPVGPIQKGAFVVGRGDVERHPSPGGAERHAEPLPCRIVLKFSAQHREGVRVRLERDDPTPVAQPAQEARISARVRSDVEDAVDLKLPKELPQVDVIGEVLERSHRGLGPASRGGEIPQTDERTADAHAGCVMDSNRRGMLSRLSPAGRGKSRRRRRARKSLRGRSSGG